MECPACNGSGEVQVPEHLDRLLKLVKRYPDSTVELLHSKQDDEISANAVNNRITLLMAYGLVQRRKEGRNFRYSLSK
jgi:predicted transcriptional regulator